MIFITQFPVEIGSSAVSLVAEHVERLILFMLPDAGTLQPAVITIHSSLWLSLKIGRAKRPVKAAITVVTGHLHIRLERPSSAPTWHLCSGVLHNRLTGPSVSIYMLRKAAGPLFYQ